MQDYRFRALRTTCNPRPHLVGSLKNQSGLEFNYASRQSPTGLPEVRIIDGHFGRPSGERNEVELVKEVEEVHAKIQLRVLTLEKGQSCGFDEACIECLITRPTE